MIEGRQLVGLWVVLDVVETVPAVEDVADFEADRAGVEPGLGIVRGLIAVVVAIEFVGPWAGPMVVVHCEIVVALTVEAGSEPSVAVPVSMPAAYYRRTDRTQCP